MEWGVPLHCTRLRELHRQSQVLPFSLFTTSHLDFFSFFIPVITTLIFLYFLLSSLPSSRPPHVSLIMWSWAGHIFSCLMPQSFYPQNHSDRPVIAMPCPFYLEHSSSETSCSYRMWSAVLRLSAEAAPLSPVQVYLFCYTSQKLPFSQMEGETLHQQKDLFACFIVTFALSWWSGTKTTVLPRYAYTILAF